MQTISVDELQAKLRAIKGCRAVSITTLTVPTLNKKVNGDPNPYYGRVKKRSYSSVMIGFRYENSVNNQREREGLEADFEAKPRPWGKHVQGDLVSDVSSVFDVDSTIERDGRSYVKCKVVKMPYMFEPASRVEHDGAFYFECDVNGLPYVYHWTPLIEHNGKFYLECKLERTIDTQYLVDGEVVEYDVIKPYFPVRKESSRQGVDKTVKPFDPALENIETLVMNGDSYSVVKEEVLV
jgi:hypothetical protein